MKEAFHIATTGRPGPVLDRHAQGRAGRARSCRLRPPTEPARLPTPDRRRPRRARAAAGRRALITPGQAADHLRRRRHHQRRGVAPSCARSPRRPASRSTTDPDGPRRLPQRRTRCALDMLGMHGTVYANYAVNEADLLLALGVRFDDRVTGKVERVRQARQDRPHRHRPVGDQQEQGGPHRPSSATSALTRSPSSTRRVPSATSGRSRDWVEQIAGLEDAEPVPATTRTATTPSCRSTPSSELWQLMHDRGGRRSSSPASASTRCGRPSTTSSTARGTGSPRGGLGTMGFGLPAAWARQAAHPDKLVIDIDGDGSFLMNIQELATAADVRAAGEGAAAQQPAPGHGRAVGGPVLRGPLRRHQLRALPAELRGDRGGLRDPRHDRARPLRARRRPRRGARLRRAGAGSTSTSTPRPRSSRWSPRARGRTIMVGSPPPVGA